MTGSPLLKTLAILTGLVIAGEALALAVGMHCLSPRDNPWISAKNDLLLALDFIAGAGLVILAATSRNLDVPDIFYGLVAISAAAHGYRAWEYFTRTSHAFCINRDLVRLDLAHFPACWAANPTLVKIRRRCSRPAPALCCEWLRRSVIYKKNS
ncbi:MAG: hypothetical protein JXA21_03495 [Anaerolineae bacterium]|nr:hypothetical protein [Anaerolineae bacterium]